MDGGNSSRNAGSGNSGFSIVMLIDKLISERREYLNEFDFEELDKELTTGVYSPMAILDLALSVIFIITHDDKSELFEHLETLGKIVGMLRASLTEDKDCQIPLTTINLRHMIATIEQIWDKVSNYKETVCNMYQ